MEQETNANEIAANGNRKTMLGVRCFAELKFKLTEEAIALGITLSEHCESILLTRTTLLLEKDEAVGLTEELTKRVHEATATLAMLKTQYKVDLQKEKVETDRLIVENDQLMRNAKLMKQQLVLFTDKRLLFLFEKVKGKEDTIDGADGQKYTVTYNQPKDLLEAMIYSFNYKKP